METDLPPELIDLVDDGQENSSVPNCNNIQDSCNENEGQGEASANTFDNPGGDVGGAGLDGGVEEVGGGLDGGAGLDEGGGSYGEGEWPGFNWGYFSIPPTMGDACPQVTQILRKQYLNLGKCLTEVNEKYSKEMWKLKDSYFQLHKDLDKKIKEKDAKLRGYSQQLQSERLETQRQWRKWEAEANEKLLSLSRQLEEEKNVTANLRSELRAAENEKSDRILQLEHREQDLVRECHSLMETNTKLKNKNGSLKKIISDSEEEYSQNISVKENEISVIKEERDTMAEKKKTLKKELKKEKETNGELIAENDDLKLRLDTAIGQLGSIMAALKTPERTGPMRRQKSGSLAIVGCQDSCDEKTSSQAESPPKRRLTEESGTPDQDEGGRVAKIRRSADSSWDNHLEQMLTTGQKEARDSVSPKSSVPMESKSSPRPRGRPPKNGDIGAKKSSGSSRDSSRGSTGSKEKGTASPASRDPEMPALVKQVSVTLTRLPKEYK